MGTLPYTRLGLKIEECGAISDPVEGGFNKRLLARSLQPTHSKRARRRNSSTSFFCWCFPQPNLTSKLGRREVGW